VRLLLLVVMVPPLVLAGFGISHPSTLDAGSAPWWRDLHVILLPVFPLLALGPWLVARAVARPGLSWVVAALGYVYATFYTALDVLAGIGAGTSADHGFFAPLGSLFSMANSLARVGVDAYLAAALLAAGAAVLAVRGADRGPAVAGAVLVLYGAIQFLDSHIYWPRGVWAMVALAVGWGLLAWSVRTVGVPEADPADLGAVA
jgi:hypothetical protein